MNVWVNGELTQINGAQTVAEVAESLGFGRHTVLIEHNGVALHQHEWPQRALSEGDRLELLRVAAGG